MKTFKKASARRFAVKAAPQFGIAPHDAFLDPRLRNQARDLTGAERRELAETLSRWAGQLLTSVAMIEMAGN